MTKKSYLLVVGSAVQITSIIFYLPISLLSAEWRLSWALTVLAKPPLALHPFSISKWSNSYICNIKKLRWNRIYVTRGNVRVWGARCSQSTWLSNKHNQSFEAAVQQWLIKRETEIAQGWDYVSLLALQKLKLLKFECTRPPFAISCHFSDLFQKYA